MRVSSQVQCPSTVNGSTPTLNTRFINRRLLTSESLDPSVPMSVVVYLDCAEVGLVSRPHLLFGGVRSVTTVLKDVEEEQQGPQEIDNEKKRKLDGMESSKSKSDAHNTHG